MNAAYGTRLVPKDMHGRAITVIMSGNTLGISIGLPLMTSIGITFGWRSVFVVLGLIVVAIGVLVYFHLPSVKGERMSKSNSPFTIIRMPAILIVLLLTFLSVKAHSATFIGGMLLEGLLGFFSVSGGVYMSLACFILATNVALMARKTLRSA